VTRSVILVVIIVRIVEIARITVVRGTTGGGRG
jgi:hypothetical protein